MQYASNIGGFAWQYKRPFLSSLLISGKKVSSLCLTHLLILKLEDGKRPKHWEDGIRCRAFFDQYANSKGLNALDPESWYSVPLQELNAAVSGLLLLPNRF